MTALPDFKSHKERDDYFRDNADYFSVIRMGGIGVSERIEAKTLAEAEKAIKIRQAVIGGRFLIYAVIDQQSALAKTVK